jgi:hypothetical protein
MYKQTKPMTNSAVGLQAMIESLGLPEFKEYGSHIP